MIRAGFGILMLLGAVVLLAVTILRRDEPGTMPLEAMLIITCIYIGLGTGLLLWGRSAMRRKKVLKALAEAFAEGDECDAPDDTGASLYGALIAPGESMVAQLIPEKVERMYYQRGQVAAVTDRRLLFLMPQKHVGRDLSKYYAIKSIVLGEVREVSHRKAAAIGGMLAGLILIGIACGYAYGGLSGQLIGPGVIFVPIIAGSSGAALVFGVRRRVITFVTQYGEIRWRSGPLEIGKTASLAAQVRDHFMSLQIPVRGFEQSATSGGT